MVLINNKILNKKGDQYYYKCTKGRCVYNVTELVNKVQDKYGDDVNYVNTDFDNLIHSQNGGG